MFFFSISYVLCNFVYIIIYAIIYVCVFLAVGICLLNKLSVLFFIFVALFCCDNSLNIEYLRAILPAALFWVGVSLPHLKCIT